MDYKVEFKDSFTEYGMTPRRWRSFGVGMGDGEPSPLSSNTDADSDQNLKA